ncbi:hypothetical protein [Flavobacterium maritimum]|uniref:hypothetical protein n=1 Tax=Flavobacterium maritimum TaxID=3149042 RepID=UPI0032B4B1A2
MQKKIELIKIEEENKFLIKSGDVFFSITEIMYIILEKYRLDWPFSKIALYLNQEKNTVFYNEEIINSIISDDKIKEIIALNTKYTSKSSYIYLKIKLIDPYKIKKLLHFLSIYLFNKKIFSFLSILGTVTSISYNIFFFDNISNLQNRLNSNIVEQLPQFITIYLLFILIIFLHEIGHASASYRYDIMPKEIGFGFYFTMPVLYTELTGIWSLKKTEKILVNISGIYFQLILNIIFVLILLLNSENIIVSILFLINCFSILFALNPFFKNDGYWIFSDYFNIVNLEMKADKCFIQLFRFIFSPKQSLLFLRDKRKILVLYSFVSFLFWFYFFFKTTKYMIINAKNHYESILNGFDLITWGKIVLYVFFVYMFIKSTYHRIKTIITN